MPAQKTWTVIEESTLLQLATDSDLSDNMIAKKMTAIFKKEFTGRMIQNKRQRLSNIRKNAGRKSNI